MPPPSPGTATIDANRQASATGLRHEPGNAGRLSADEIAGPAEFSGTCFEHCSPIRTRCPGPGAQMSSDRGGPRWLPICRRAVG
jgi:hypothetical protein